MVAEPCDGEGCLGCGEGGADDVGVVVGGVVVSWWWCVVVCWSCVYCW